MDQVKEEFVYFPDRRGTLDDWGKYLFGVGKFAEQETLLKEYLAGNLPFVEAFNKRQVELLVNLYALSRFVASESILTPISPIFPNTPDSGSIPGGSSHSGNKEIECPYCHQANNADNRNCKVCMQRISL